MEWYIWVAIAVLWVALGSAMVRLAIAVRRERLGRCRAHWASHLGHGGTMNHRQHRCGSEDDGHYLHRCACGSQLYGVEVPRDV